MLILISLILLNSLIFLFLNHPLSLGSILLIQTVIISLVSGMMSLNFWFSYILFLIMIGGMLILFIYMTNVASNEKFHFSSKMFNLFSISIILIMMLSFSDKFKMNLFINNMDLKSATNFMNFEFSLNKFSNFPMNLILILMIIYLLITLIVIVKIMNLKSGPLRQNF
uniref:NADH-ubiquinone oxidoreductase chain 6 n=1 Tax=Brentidae sp. GENSP01 TaxID=1205806 RepID=A0A0S2MQY1_9CUCU|nr:NADH deshydrogenase subunit 6 [Brentidae sp. GENSP01]